MAKRIFVTGGNGFLGKYLVNNLLQKGYIVTCFTRNSNNNINRKAKIIIGNLEKGIPDKALKGNDWVIHAASEVKNPNWKLNYSSNVVGTNNLINSCKKNGIKRLIYIGTINSELKKKASYGITKRIAENIVKKSGLDFVILRPSMIYGPEDHNLSKTIRLVKKLPIIPIIGDGQSTMQPVYVEDVVSAIIECIKRNLSKQTYNLVGPDRITFDEYMDIILEATSQKKPKIHLPLILIKPLVYIIEKIQKNPILTLEQVYSINQNQQFNISYERVELDYNPAHLRDVIKKLL